MDEQFILIPGRTSRQGTSLNEGKLKANYIDETNTLFMCPEDMKRLELAEGARVRVRSEYGMIELPCKAAKGGEVPTGLLFLPYGDPSSKLVGGDTQGTGMPDSKCFDVTIEKLL